MRNYCKICNAESDEKMLKVIMTKGLPASGKSTWAKQLLDENPHQWKRVNKDDLRAMLDNGLWSKKNEQFVLRMEEYMMVEALKAGKHVILDNTHIEGKHFERVKNVLKNNGLQERVQVEIKEFDVPLEECIKRDLKRPNSVGEHVIKRMWKKWHGPMDRKQYLKEYDPKLPDCVIFDIDGTLALMDGRSPYEWQRVDEDLPNRDIVKIHNVIYDTFLEAVKGLVFVVSGRDEICREKTEYWLAKHDISYDFLFMRPEGDTRKDTVVKEEIYKKYIEGKYNVIAVFDDRKSVVQTWRELGLTCLQVAEGDF